MDNSNVGQLIASERKRCGLTQKELADKLAISDKPFQNGKPEEVYRRIRPGNPDRDKTYWYTQS